MKANGEIYSYIMLSINIYSQNEIKIVELVLIQKKILIPVFL